MLSNSPVDTYFDAILACTALHNLPIDERIFEVQTNDHNSLKRILRQVMLILHPSSCCDVCLEEYTWDDTAQAPFAIPCGHVFCKTCVTAVTPRKCPLCRNPFVHGTIKKLHVDHLVTSEQQELELLRKLALSWGMPDDQQVKVLKEIDAWLGDRAEITSPCVSVSTGMGSAFSPIKGMALIKAREAAAKCQQLLRCEEQDGKTIRQLKREVQDFEHLRTENIRRVAQCEAQIEELQNEKERKEALHEAKVEYLEAKVEYLTSAAKAEVQFLKAKAELLGAISGYKTEIECRKAEVEYLKANIDSHVAQKTAEIECLRGEITGSNDPAQSLMENFWTDECHWSTSPLASFRDFIVPHYKEIEVRTRCLNDENRSLSRELEAAKSLLEKPQTLSQVSDREPKEARVFVAKPDAFSTADLLTTASPLNEDAFKSTGFCMGIASLIQSWRPK